MKSFLLPIAVSIVISLPVIAFAKESQSSAQKSEVNQSERQNEFKHDHRKHKGLPSSAKSNATDSEKGSEKKKKTHNHKKVHK